MATPPKAPRLQARQQLNAIRKELRATTARHRELAAEAQYTRTLTHNKRPSRL